MAFPKQHPKFNRYSFPIINACEGKLLQHQADALTALKNRFSETDNSEIALVSMPTGSGKTGVICCLPYFLGSIGMHHSPGNFPTGTPTHEFKEPILVLAPNLELADQLERQILIAENNNDNFFFRRKIIQTADDLKDVLPHGRKIQGTQELTHPDSLKGEEVIIANVQKFLSKKQLPENARWWVEQLPSDLFKVVIVDEAHHFPSLTWRRIIEKFKEHALVVFFTATPFRADGKMVVDHPFTYHLSLDDAVKRRIIRQTRFLSLETDDNDDVPEEQALLVVLTEVMQMQERKNIDHPLPNNVPHMAIAITKNTTEAERLKELWNNIHSPSAIAYHSNVPKAELQQRMTKIKTNQVKLVVVVDMLQEGFDHPPISIAAILTKIGSPVKFAQFIGRAQRIVRCQEGLESSLIKADVVTHSSYKQEANYEKFKSGAFIEYE